MPQSGWLIKNGYVFLTVVEVGKFMIKAPADSVSGEGLLPNGHILLVSSHGRRDERALWGLFL